MANDIDMWNDIEELERLGDTKNAELMGGVFQAYFIDYDMVETKEAIEQAHDQSDYPFDFSGYGISTGD